jgi:Alpha/beta hydrolase domain
MICTAQIKKRTAVLWLFITLLLVPALSQARVISVQMSAPTIAFGGYSWPGVGQYEKITGVAYAEVDPADHRNAIIVDIGLAEPQAAPGQPGKTPSGKVAYLLNFYILKPVNLDQVDRSLNGYGKVMYEPPNRGNKTWAALGRITTGPGGANDPASIIDTTVLENSFLMPRGYTLVWSGWEPLIPLANLGTSLTASAALPIAKNPDGSAITGPAYEYSAGGGASISLSYPAADPTDKTTAKLTHRVKLNDPPEVIPSTGWEYTTVNGEPAIRLASGNFVANDIYEFSYTAKDPTVAGLGFAAVRDWVSWLRYNTSATNPLANYINRIYTEISSQPGRLFNDFRYLGFNEDERGRKVFDGHMQWISAGSGIGMNYRFSQSGRTERNRQDHLYPENLFPFANVPTTDPFTGKTDSRYARCLTTRTCPFGMEIYSANEYWVKTASLLHTTPDGASDLPDSPYTRNYLMSSMRHGTGNAANRGNCQQFDNPLNSAPVQRALFIALDEWANTGKPPPNSRVPRLSDGTLVLPADTGFPTNIPDLFGETPNGKVTYTGLKTTRYRFDLGPGFYETGIPTIFPPVITAPLEIDTAVPIVSVNGPIYPSFVPKTDRDGNDIAGVRLPDVTVPLATYTGWALRRGAHAHDGCEAAGQYIPFPKTKASREMSGDPRRSIEERYPSFEKYYDQVKRAVENMVRDRLLLCEDADDQLERLVQAGLDAGVPAPNGELADSELRHCKPHKFDGGKK